MDRDQHGVVHGRRGVEQRESVGRADGPYAPVGQPDHVPVAEAAGHGAALLPEAPAQRLGRQARGPAALGQRVEEGVGRGVVGLTGRAERRRRGGEQHERGELEVARQLVEQQRRVGLGPQYAVHLLRRQRRDRCVVEHAGRVHHPGQRPVGGNAGDDLGHRRAVGRVTADGHHPGARRRQFLDQTRIRAGACDQNEIAHSVPVHQVPCGQPAEDTARTGDEDRAVRVPLRLLAGRRGPYETRREYGTVPDRDLRFAAGHGDGQPLVDVVGRTEVEQHELTGVLALRRPDQAPHRRVHRVPGSGPGRTAGDEHQTPVVLVLRGQPLLDPGQRPVSDGVHVVVRSGEVRHLVQRYVRAVGGRRVPVDPVQRPYAGGLQLSCHERARHQRLDGGDRGSGGVGDGDRDLVGARRRQPDPQGRRARRVQARPAPGERQPDAGGVAR